MATDIRSFLRKLYSVPDQTSIPGGGAGFRPAPGSAPEFAPTVAAPTVTAPAGPPADAGGTWEVPDYGALLDQFMAPYAANIQAQDAANLASRNAGFKRAAIQFGQLPNLGQVAGDLGLSQADLAGVFGPDTQALAEGNTKAGTSTVARLNEAHQDAVRGITNALAARGILHSGETGFQQGRENTNYGRSQYDALNKLLDYFSGLQSGYAQAKQQAANALAQQKMQTALQLQGMFQPTFHPNPGYNQTGGFDPTQAPYGLDASGKPIDLSSTFNAFPYAPSGAPPKPVPTRRSPFGHQPA